MRRAAIVCPGRGSYTEASLRSLDPADERVRLADQLREQRGLEPLSALDGAERFSPARHLRPANVSALIYVVSFLDAERAAAAHRVTCVLGNSMGWYTALAVGGALSFEDGFRLVQEMALLQEASAAERGGGQVIYPVVDEDWRPDAALERAVERALATSNGQALPSIRLGGYRVLAGTDEGVAHLQRELPALERGRVRYPFRLAQHGPYHTPLAADVSARAREALADLAFRRPAVTLIDGRGMRWTPWSSDLAALSDYTLGAQVTEPYDFTASVRVALREHAPDRLVLPGPGNTLGGVCGQILVAEGWRGIRAREDFARVQESDAPIVESMAR